MGTARPPIDPSASTSGSSTRSRRILLSRTWTRRQVIGAGAFGAAAAAGGSWLAASAPEQPRRARTPVALTASPLSAGFAAGSAILYMSTADRRQTLDLVTATGIGWIRFDVPWNFVSPQAGSYQWTFVDNVVNDCRARGLTILLSVVNSPSWAAAVPGNPQSRPASATTYANFCGKVATRYRDSVSAMEIWNEPNGRMFFAPDPDPAFYTQMVRAAYPVIKAKAPAMTVIAGALGAVDTADGLVHAVDFLRAAYQNGLAGRSDAISFHPYDYSNPLATGALYDNAPMRNMIDMYRSMSSNGDGGKKIWITEYGAPTTGSISQTDQAELISNSIGQWREVSYAGPFMIHTIRDAATGSTDPEDNFGVATTAFVPKQSMVAVTALSQAGFPLRPEYQLLQVNPDPTLGQPVSPVYPLQRGFGYEFTEGARYATNNGFFSSPPEVATIARRFRVVPLGTFAYDRQDFDVDGGFRVFSRPDTTGTHAVYGAILAAWSPAIGFPTGTLTSTNGVTTQQFENGAITWSALGGTHVDYS